MRRIASRIRRWTLTRARSAMIFGTYRNPEMFEGEVGFYDGASARVGDMLLGRDVSVPA